MRAEIEHIKKDIETLAQFNSTPGEGMTRFSFTQEDYLAREYVISEMRRIGLKVSVDPAGNIIGKLDGREPSATPVMSGSHLDSVPHGGIFDGTAGVVAGLEAARVISSSAIDLRRPIGVIVFSEEEGSGRFRSPILGSRALTGQINKDALKEIVDSDGISIAKVMADFGLKPNSIEKATMPANSIYAFLELHIEQGPVLEENQKPVGIVTAISSIEGGTIDLHGISGHAGTVPMELRHDSMTAAAHMILRINEIVKSLGSPQAVGTVGFVRAFPGSINIIPANVSFTYDVRDPDSKRHEQILKEIKEIIPQIANEYGVQEKITVNVNSKGIRLSEEVIGLIQDAARDLGIPTQTIVSGAGHDAMVMHRISQHVGMIFVCSKGGHSHRPDEWTEFSDLVAGCELLLETIIRLASQ